MTPLILSERCALALTYWKVMKTSGLHHPTGIAAEAAKGDVLAFLNNDTRVDSRWIREGISVLDRPKGIVCSASKLMSWNGRHVEFNGGTLQYLGYADQLTANDVKSGEGDTVSLRRRHVYP